ncbi:MAG: VaFE repeat-containing surface-anchored protein, partial [Oscillospiraceae bacterium]|nr:VaFE repeat-containing surface-anchored protein [Oscillospiraceae bacterium]
GTLFIRELTPSPGFDLDPTIYEVTITAANHAVTQRVTSPQPPRHTPPMFQLRKLDSDGVSPQGSATLADAQYTLRWFPGVAFGQNPTGTPAMTLVYQTDANGRIDFTNPAHLASGTPLFTADGRILFPLGAITLEETLAPTGYLIDSTIHVGYIESAAPQPGATFRWANGSSTLIRYSTTEGISHDEYVIRGGVRIPKVDSERGTNEAQGDATLQGAVFAIYNVSPNPVVVNGTIIQPNQRATTISTGADGWAATASDTLPFGDFEIREDTPPTGYHLNTTWSQRFSIREHGVVIEPFNDTPLPQQVIRGGLRIQKVDSDRDTSPESGVPANTPQGDASLADAVFEIINRSATSILMLDGTVIMPGEVVMTIATNAEGIAQTAANALPFGTYEAHEKIPPSGYLLNDAWNAIIEIREEGVIVDAATNVRQYVIRGGVEVEKRDRELNLLERLAAFFGRGAQGDATLAGTVFDITNQSTHSVFVDGQWFEPGERIMSITTVYEIVGGTRMAVARTDAYTLPYGSFMLQEVAESVGYLLTDGDPRYFQIRRHGVIVTGTIEDDDLLFTNYVIRGDVRVEKWDLELDASEAIGGRDTENGTTLEGIEFTIWNRSEQVVLVDGELFEPDEIIMTLLSFWCSHAEAYIAETTGRALPYGTYEIRETLPNQSYLLSDGAPRFFQVREDGEVITVDVDGVPLVWRNQVRRGDFSLIKIAAETGRRMGYVPFEITNMTTGESRVIVTDRNGEFNSSATWNDRFHNTNGNDHLLEMEANGEAITRANMDSLAGVWFGLGEFGSMAEIRDDLGALPFGLYSIREIPAETNQSFAMLEFTFFVYRHGVVVDLSTLTNLPIAPEIGTTAWCTQTQNNISATGEVTIIDTVHLSGLIVGETYTLRGIIMNQEIEGQPILVGGRAIRSETTFVATRADMDVDLAFTFDASALADTHAVIFERLYHNGRLVASHEDPDAESQWIRFPYIGTTLWERDTGKSVIGPDERVVLVDRVAFRHLVPGLEYTLRGWLMDKDTGQPLLVNGERVTSETVFIPDAPHGYADVIFEFDARGLEGATLVAFESLYLDSVLIATHHDMECESQTVWIPHISTLAFCARTLTDYVAATGSAVVTDRVTFENLVPGLTYRVRGILMDRETRSPFLVNGETVTAELEFVPTTAEGYVELDFGFDARTFATYERTTIVVFQRLYLVATATGLPDLPTEDDMATDTDTDAPAEDDVDDRASVTDGADEDTGDENDVEDESNTTSGEEIERLVAIHEDIYDLGQTVFLVNGIMWSNARVFNSQFNYMTDEQLIENGTQEADPYSGKLIIDFVSMDLLVPGQHYLIRGILMDRATDEPLRIDNETITSEIYFTATTRKMTVRSPFRFDSSDLAGTTFVIFQRLYHVTESGTETETADNVYSLVATDEDINNQSQTIWVRTPDAPTPTPTPTPTPIPAPTPESTAPNTGDDTLLPWGLLILAAIGLFVAGTALVVQNVKTKKS